MIRIRHTVVLLFLLLGQALAAAAAPAAPELYFSGTLNGKIPVFLHYSVTGKVVIGEIVYLNTKTRQPIALAGFVQADKSLSLEEFAADGSITGVLRFTAGSKGAQGTWTPPNRTKGLPLQLLPKDTVLANASPEPAPEARFGEYCYRYGKDGGQGCVTVRKLGGGKAEISINAVTALPQANVADVEPVQVALNGNSITCTIPDSEGCRFTVRFFRQFVWVDTRTDACSGQFGAGATIDGLYRKTSR